MHAPDPKSSIQIQKKHRAIEQAHNFLDHEQQFRKKNCCVFAFIDIHKAFDKVRHQRFLY